MGSTVGKMNGRERRQYVKIKPEFTGALTIDKLTSEEQALLLGSACYSAASTECGTVEVPLLPCGSSILYLAMDLMPGSHTTSNGTGLATVSSSGITTGTVFAAAWQSTSRYPDDDDDDGAGPTTSPQQSLLARRPRHQMSSCPCGVLLMGSSSRACCTNLGVDGSWRSSCRATLLHHRTPRHRAARRTVCSARRSVAAGVGFEEPSWIRREEDAEARVAPVAPWREAREVDRGPAGLEFCAPMRREAASSFLAAIISLQRSAGRGSPVAMTVPQLGYSSSQRATPPHPPRQKRAPGSAGPGSTGGFGAGAAGVGGGVLGAVSADDLPSAKSGNRRFRWYCWCIKGK